MGTNQNGGPAQLRQTTQIIALGLIMGVVTLGIVLAIVIDWTKLNFSLSPLAGVAVALLVATSLASFVVPGQLLRSAGRQFQTKNPAAGDSALDHAGMTAIQTKTIIRGALNESSALFGFIILYLETNLVGLIVAVVSIALLIAAFPFGTRVDADMETFRDEYRRAR